MIAVGLHHSFSLPDDFEAIIRHISAGIQRLLFIGPTGVGKSTVITSVGKELHGLGRSCWCIGADPGSPQFGVPGAVSLAHWEGDGWQVKALEALCTLDAGRFRLPLVCAVARLVDRITADGLLFVDAPGVVRGVAGAELLEGLVAVVRGDLIVALRREGQTLPLARELASLAGTVLDVRAAAQAVSPGKRLRASRRTSLWDSWLAEASEYQLDIDALNLIGTPPPTDIPSTWAGRQVALLEGDRTRTIGEVISLDNGRLSLRLPKTPGSASTLLVRDAQRVASGRLETGRPFTADRIAYRFPESPRPISDNGGAQPMGRVGMLDVHLVNGVFGDPLLHARLRHERRSLLFDLGEGARLSARIAHQVSDVFISHAHMDHIGGFLWLMRSRIGEISVCRLWGPPGLADHIEGLVTGILWDRIGDRGPRFRIFEVHGDELREFYIQAGKGGKEGLGATEIEGDILFAELGFKIRAVNLDHQTPVLAFAFEPEREYNVCKDRLKTMGLEAGPWLGELKRHLRRNEPHRVIVLPDGRRERVANLEKELIVVSPRKRLVYATDFADTEKNRRQVVRLAHEAHTFFCEAAFLEADQERAERTAHITTRTCGEISEEAGVARLIPFHFSRRYEERPEQIYDEIAAYCSAVVRPQ